MLHRLRGNKQITRAMQVSLLPQAVPRYVVFLAAQHDEDARPGGKVVQLAVVGIVLPTDRVDGLPDETLLRSQIFLGLVGLGRGKRVFEVGGDSF
jgi:hypothetical protein